MMVIDAHHHVWDLAVRDQDWITGEQMAPIRRTFTLADLRSAARAAGVSATVLVCLLASDYAGVTALARSLVAGLPGSEQAAVFGGTAAWVYRIAGAGTVGGMGAGSWR
jgi:predicted TIM-barrel fold metal-dependent hydrolase